MLNFNSIIFYLLHVKKFGYAIIESVLLSGAKPTEGGHASQQVSQAIWRQIGASNIQLLQLGLLPFDGLHMLAQQSCN